MSGKDSEKNFYKKFFFKKKYVPLQSQN